MLWQPTDPYLIAFQKVIVAVVAIMTAVDYLSIYLVTFSLFSDFFDFMWL
jgi:hypothetical protein